MIYYISTKRCEIQPPWSTSARDSASSSTGGADSDARGDLAFGIHPDRGGGAGDAEGAARGEALIEEHRRAKAARPVGFDRAGGHEDEPRTLGLHAHLESARRAREIGELRRARDSEREGESSDQQRNGHSTPRGAAN